MPDARAGCLFLRVRWPPHLTIAVYSSHSATLLTLLVTFLSTSFWIRPTVHRFSCSHFGSQHFSVLHHWAGWFWNIFVDMLVLSVPTLVSTGSGSRMSYSVSSLWYFGPDCVATDASTHCCSFVTQRFCALDRQAGWFCHFFVTMLVLVLCVPPVSL